MVSTRHPFPSGYHGRLALTNKMLDTLHHLAVHIGAEMTRVHLAVPCLQRFFLAFDKADGIKDERDDIDRYTLVLFHFTNIVTLSMLKCGVLSCIYVMNMSGPIDFSRLRST